MIDLIVTQQEFLKQLKTQGKSFNTLKNYRADLEAFNKFLTQHNRPLMLKTFAPKEAQEYAQFLENTYGSPNSIRRRVQALRLYFDFLVVRHSFPLNPIKQMAVAPKLLEKPNPPSFKDLIKVKDSLLKLSLSESGLSLLMVQRNLIIFALIYESGLKVSDLSRLEMSDILMDKKGPRVLVRPDKREPYSIPLSPSFSEMFKTYKVTLMENWNLAQKPSHLFFNANPFKILSGTLSPRGIELVFESIREKTKTDITARNLRQACVFRWMNLMTPTSQIKKWLGVAPDYDMALYNEVFNTQKPIYLDIPYA